MWNHGHPQGGGGGKCRHSPPLGKSKNLVEGLDAHHPYENFCGAHVWHHTNYNRSLPKYINCTPVNERHCDSCKVAEDECRECTQCNIPNNIKSNL